MSAGDKPMRLEYFMQMLIKIQNAGITIHFEANSLVLLSHPEKELSCDSFNFAEKAGTGAYYEQVAHFMSAFLKHPGLIPPRGYRFKPL